jgi:3-oxoacyl-[acyl-carrier protein] reductase
MGTSLAGRHALVCGASQGIGLACAEALAAEGATLTLLSRSSATLETARAGLSGDAHHCLACDMSDWTATGEAVAAHVADTGPVHILVHNSGGPKGGPLIDATPEDLLAGLATHVLCGQAIVKAVTPGMRESGYGRIINIVSTSVVTPIKGLGVSNTVRGAINNWMRTLAGELGPDGITVNNILPGFVDTDRLAALMASRAERTGTTAEAVKAAWIDTVPLGRLAAPAEVGAACAFLASPAASFINGVNLPVDGGRLASM